ncbi:DUF6226 family protein [Streptomyces sp. NPDC050145]|uniref:DUF6226 family protein n=1 Tax=Streptomyces sp. NPDC050145 TaxID=3365602 RepID=UPI0037A6065B
MDRSVLLRAVDEAFAETGADTPHWPDPHADREVRDEEYSRCLDPAKYRVLAARAEAWTRVLCGLGLAREERIPVAARALWRGEPGASVDEVVRLWPLGGAGAVPLLFGFGAIDDVPRTVLTVGAGEPAVSAAQVPDCGCDACDDGSAGILEVLDEAVLAVVTGEFVHVDAGRGRTVTALLDGWSASDWERPLPGVEGALTKARAGTSPYDVVVGRAWEAV